MLDGKAGKAGKAFVRLGDGLVGLGSVDEALKACQFSPPSPPPPLLVLVDEFINILLFWGGRLDRKALDLLPDSMKPGLLFPPSVCFFALFDRSTDCLDMIQMYKQRSSSLRLEDD